MTPLKIGEKTYQLKYDTKAVLKLEQIIATHNILQLLANGAFSTTDTINCLYVGLLYDKPSMTLHKAMRLLDKWNEENSIIALQGIIVNAMSNDHVIGRADFSEEADEEEEKK